MDDDRFEVFTDRGALLDRFQDQLASAREHVVFVVPVELVPELRSELRDARERGILVALQLAGASEAPFEQFDFENLANVVRYWQTSGPVGFHGIVDGGGMLARSIGGEVRADEANTLVFEHPRVWTMTIATVLGNIWPLGRQVHVGEPAPLPREYASHYHAIVDATQHLLDRRRLHATVTGYRLPGAGNFEPAGPKVTVEGTVINVRQGFVSPTTSTVGGENAMELETDEGRIWVGGPEAFLEDFRATEIRLECVE